MRSLSSGGIVQIDHVDLRRVEQPRLADAAGYIQLCAAFLVQPLVIFRKKSSLQLQPDVIVLTGDMISRDMRDFHEISSFLQALSKISPTYLCTGNHELDLPPEVQQEFWAMADQ